MLAHRQLGLDFVYKHKLKHAAFDLRADGAEGGSGNDTASDADADDSGSSGSASGRAPDTPERPAVEHWVLR
jgi:hypothetical protein